MATITHEPVLLAETLRLLDPKFGDIVVDCTVGQGGHSASLVEAIKPNGKVIGFDLDPANLALAQERMGGMLQPIHSNFSAAPDHMKRLGLRADIVLADLGFSSNQMADPIRGLSFSADGPLDMRLNPASSITAADLLAALSERELADIIYRFGEEPLARKIARKLAQIRHAEPIRSTAQLARLVTQAYGTRAASSRMHPATRTFMALRIAVNDELGALQTLMDGITQGAEQVDRGGWLNAGARVALIGFHSLEDRLVKHAFAGLIKRGLAIGLTKKPIAASETEVRNNPRARSAKLRAVRIGSPNLA